MPVPRWRSALGSRLREVAELLDPSRGTGASGAVRPGPAPDPPTGIGAGAPGRRLDLDNAPEHWVERVRAAGLGGSAGPGGAGPVEPLGGSSGAPVSRPRRLRPWRRSSTERASRPWWRSPWAHAPGGIPGRPADGSGGTSARVTPTLAPQHGPASPSAGSPPARESARPPQADDAWVRRSAAPGADGRASPTDGGRDRHAPASTRWDASSRDARRGTDVPAGAADGRLLLPFPDRPVPGREAASPAAAAPPSARAWTAPARPGAALPGPDPTGSDRTGPAGTAPSPSRPAHEGAADPASRVTLPGAAGVAVGTHLPTVGSPVWAIGRTGPASDGEPATEPLRARPPVAAARPSPRRDEGEHRSAGSAGGSQDGGAGRLGVGSGAAADHGLRGSGAAAPQPAALPAHADPWPPLPVRADPPAVVVPAAQLEAVHSRALRLAREQAAV